MNLKKLIAFDKYLSTGYQLNITLTQLTILMGLFEGAKNESDIALLLDRSMSNTQVQMRLLRLHNSQNPKAIGFIHKPLGDGKYHLTEAGKAWLDDLLKT